jgi:hypothetical protein
MTIGMHPQRQRPFSLRLRQRTRYIRSSVSTPFISIYENDLIVLSSESGTSGVNFVVRTVYMIRV